MPPPQAFLDQLRIASPCPADWAEMTGDDRARFCEACGKHVYDLSRMTAAEGRALILAMEGRAGGACVRLWRRADGTVITSDCPVGLHLTARWRTRAPLAAVALLAAALSQAACAPKVKPEGAPAARAASARPPSPDPGAQGIQIEVGGVGPAPGDDLGNQAQGAVFRMEDISRLPLR